MQLQRDARSIISIVRPSTFKPGFVSPGCSVWWQDERALQATEIDPGDVELVQLPRHPRSRVLGRWRSTPNGFTPLDTGVFQVLWEEPWLIPESWQKLTCNTTTFVFFDGTVIQTSQGNLVVVCLGYL